MQTNNMEGTESTHDTKISDSAYSHSCSNSQSQRSGSSKSRNSGSHSSGSSGYGGKQSTQSVNSDLINTQSTQNQKRLNNKDGKKKKSKVSTIILAAPDVDDISNVVTKGESEVIVNGTHSENITQKTNRDGSDSHIECVGNTRDSFPSCLPAPSPIAVDQTVKPSNEKIVENISPANEEKHSSKTPEGKFDFATDGNQPHTSKWTPIAKKEYNAKEKTITLIGSGSDSDGSSYSSFYSSFIKTSNSENNFSEVEKQAEDMCSENSINDRISCKRTKPPWMENINLTNELIFNYQVMTADVNELLQHDLRFLKENEQSLMVNDQLEQLYLDLEVEGLCTQLTLKSSAADDLNIFGDTNVQISTLTMIYEENTIFPL